MVDVIIASYNHGNSIERAINSVLMQTFKDYQIIIVDDGSTDDSVKIINKYYLDNNNIRGVIGCHNGLMMTYLQAFSECAGKYIAVCDCDDYWVDKNKLKKQVEYMEKNEDCGLCYTKVYIEENDFIRSMSISTDTINKKMSFDSLLKGDANIHAQTYMIRKKFFDKYIDFKHFINVGFKVWDYPIVLELIKHTKFHCLDFYSAVFVKNDESVTNTRSRKRRLQYLLSNYKIKSYYIKKYGCKISTILYLIYRVVRDIYSIIFRRWNKQYG